MTDQQVSSSSSSQGTVCTGLINVASMKNESACTVSSSSPPQDCCDPDTANNKLTNAGVKRMNETSSTVDSNMLKKSRINNYGITINDNKLLDDNDDSSCENKADKVMNADDANTSDPKAETMIHSTNSEKKETKNDDMMVLCMARNITEDEASSTVQQRENSLNQSKKKITQSSNQREKSNNEIRIDQLNNKNQNNPQKTNQQDSFFKGMNIQPTIQTNQQPEGWRVKLYRLNADGSWDDCGTGRIVCFINDTAIWGNILDNESKLDIAESLKEGDHTKDVNVLEEHLYQELGEPTLCMHAEIPANSSHPDRKQKYGKHPKVLLRTRVLLRDTYQRQGDNIITWCEPYFPLETSNKDQQKSIDTENLSDDQQMAAGVDLALSFQDNAGCLDIWSKISSIQNKATELFRTKGHTLSDKIPNGNANIRGNYDVEGFVEQNRGTNDNADIQSNRQQQIETNNNKSGSEGRQRIEGTDSVETSKTGSDTFHDGQSITSDKHGVNMQQQQQQQQKNHMIWSNVPSETAQHHLHRSGSSGNSSAGIAFEADGNNQEYQEADAEAKAVSMAAAAAAAVYSGGVPTNGIANSNMTSQGISNSIDQMCQAMECPQLPNPPSLNNLEEIVDTIGNAQLQQRESIALFIGQADCAYLRALLQYFPPAENKNNYHSLATLAVCVKYILLLNDPSIIESIVNDGHIFEKVCSALEYDPDLRDKANHRWFLRERAKFRTVVLMEDEDLIATIHRAFRVTYLRDTLLRPTMDENSLSTLASLLAFTHADVVKGVMCAQSPSKCTSVSSLDDSSTKSGSKDSYLVQILRMLGREVKAIRTLERETSTNSSSDKEIFSSSKSLSDGRSKPKDVKSESPTSWRSSPTSFDNSLQNSWKQHLVTQDPSLSSRKLRRKGCLSFLRELFNMVRMSLQQNDKDDFYEMIVLMVVNISDSYDTIENSVFINENSNDTCTSDADIIKMEESRIDMKGNQETLNDLQDENVNLLLLLGAILSDPNADSSERNACLEIISTISLHNPSWIRKHCLDEFAFSKENNHSLNVGRNGIFPCRPEPDERQRVLFPGPSNDLLLSMLFVLAVETDAGILLQTSEIMRMILDTEMLGDNCGFGDGVMDQDDNHSFVGAENRSFAGLHQARNGSEQNSFLTLFYDFYVQWLVAPLQYPIMIPVSASQFEGMKPENYLKTMKDIDKQESVKGESEQELRLVIASAIRTSIAIELLSFCVRAHCFRMKFFILRSRVLGNILKLLKPKSESYKTSGNRFLKLASIRLLRSILSIKDEFYHRHIIQHNLFGPVFEAFRANPIGDNLVSSTIIEMCEFIRIENIKSLLEYIVTKHLQKNQLHAGKTQWFHDHQSLEEVASPYVKTLSQLREQHEKNVRSKGGLVSNNVQNGTTSNLNSSMCLPRIGMSEKVLEDQRKFRERDEEESYFNDDDDDDRRHPITDCSLMNDRLHSKGSEFQETSKIIGICAKVRNDSPTHKNSEVLPAEMNSISKFSFTELDGIGPYRPLSDEEKNDTENMKNDLSEKSFEKGSGVVEKNSMVFDEVKTQY